MSVPWRWRKTGAAAATLMIVCGPVAAQLNLDRPAAPAPYQGKALLALAKDLHADIEARTAKLHGLEGRERAAAELSISGRILARILLMKAEELGEAGSPHAVAGLTLAGRLDEIDAAAARLRTGSLPDEAAAAAAVLAAQLREQNGAVPARTEDMDRWVRDLLALPIHAGVAPPAPPPPAGSGEPLWQAEPWRAGWGGGSTGGQNTELGEAATRWVGVPAPTVEAVRRFDEEIVRPARAWWAYRGTADAVATAIVAAGRVAEPGGLPDWVPSDSRDAMVSRFGGAALSALDPATRERAMASLAELALAAALMDRLDRTAQTSGLPPTARQRALTAARRALVAAATAPEGGRAALAAMDAALRLLGERAQVPGEETLLRDVRPAWRAMSATAREAEVALWETLGRIGPAGGSHAAPMDDPAVVGAIAALRRALDDLAALRAISAGLSTQVGDAVARNLAAQRVLRLGQDLGSAVRRETAAELLRRFGTDLADLTAFPGEQALRAAPARGVWAELTGGRAVDLAARIDMARAAWLEAWARERDPAAPSPAPGASVPGEAEADELRRLRRLVSAMHDCALLRESARPEQPGDRLVSGGLAGINAWPGWELSRRAAASLERGARGPIQRACRHVLDGNATAAEAALREYEQGWAAVRLAAALEARARERGVARTPVLVELAAPPPPGGAGWLAPLRADLAAVCRYAEEHAHADGAGDVQRRESLRAYLNDRALGALERLGAVR